MLRLLREYIREAMEAKSEPTRMPLNIPIPADLRSISDAFSSEGQEPVSYTHLRPHETGRNLV